MTKRPAADSDLIIAYVWSIHNFHHDLSKNKCISGQLCGEWKLKSALQDVPERLLALETFQNTLSCFAHKGKSNRLRCSEHIHKTRFNKIKKKKVVSVLSKQSACLTDLINIVSVESFEIAYYFKTK